MENKAVAYSFVVVGVDISGFPPRQFSTPFWEIPPESVANSVAGAIAAAYEALGYGEIKIKIIPIVA